MANYYDRNLITILVEPIKRELLLSDTQIGLLSGFGFGIAYCACAIPVARLADRHGRVRVLGASLTLWSIMTAVTGSTLGFFTMLLARAGVGLGEAGGVPATHALVADYFDSRRRGMALSLIGVCASLGSSLALVGGGLINDWRGWRAAFVFGGSAGLMFAALLLMTVREPSRTLFPAMSSATGPQSPVGRSLRQALTILRKRRSYVHLIFGLGVACMGSSAMSAWSPAFVMRTYHLSAGQVGSRFAGVVAPAALISIFLGGVINDRLVKMSKRAPLWILAASFGFNVPASIAFFSIHDFSLAMVIAFVSTIGGGLWIGPAYALIQSLAGPQLRAMAAAIFLVIFNLVGVSVGPYLAGALSDALSPRFGSNALAISLCTLSLTCVIGIVHFILAARTLSKDIAEAEGTLCEAGTH